MRRDFIPGSEWLYFKLYTGHKSADRILTEYLYPFLKSAMDDGEINKFFFIRYADPNPHIRLRLHIDNPDNYSDIFKRFYAQTAECFDNNLVSKVMCDTYQREIERYGSNTMELAEQLFSIDSIAIIKLLIALDSSDRDKEQERWLLSIRLIDDMLSLFEYSTHNKKTFLADIGDSFKREHGLVGKLYIKQLNEKFRKSHPLILQMFGGDINTEYESILRERMKFMLPIMKNLLDLNNIGNLSVDIKSLIGSYIHMTMNRLFRSKGRTYEMVIYHFMDKYYKSEIAKEKYREQK